VTHIAVDAARALAGRTLVDRHGTTIGTIAGPLGASEHGETAWLAVDVDPARHRAVIPVVDLDLGGDAVAVPYTREQVLEAPEVAGAEIETADDHALRAWYGLPGIDGSTSEGRPEFGHPGIDLD
jgi:hypothetical protein